MFADFLTNFSVSLNKMLSSAATGSFIQGALFCTIFFHTREDQIGDFFKYLGCWLALGHLWTSFFQSWYDDRHYYSRHLHSRSQGQETAKTSTVKLDMRGTTEVYILICQFERLWPLLKVTHWTIHFDIPVWKTLTLLKVTGIVTTFESSEFILLQGSQLIVIKYCLDMWV